MPITVLEVGPEHTVQTLKKLVRRYAMTGGVEIALQQSLGREELLAIVERFLPEIEKYQGQGAKLKACTAYRVLDLAAQQDKLSGGEKAQILAKLNS